MTSTGSCGSPAIRSRGRWRRSSGCGVPGGESYSCPIPRRRRSPSIRRRSPRIGIVADGDVISSSTAAAELLHAGERVLVCGGAGVFEAVAAAGAVPFEGDDAGAVADGVDVVVVGLHRSFDYERLRLATRAIRDGARFVATNRDPLFPTPWRAGPGWWIDRRGGRHCEWRRAGDGGQAPSPDGSRRSPVTRQQRRLRPATVARRGRPSVDGRAAGGRSRLPLRHRPYRQHRTRRRRRSTTRSRRRRLRCNRRRAAGRSSVAPPHG